VGEIVAVVGYVIQIETDNLDGISCLPFDTASFDLCSKLTECLRARAYPMRKGCIRRAVSQAAYIGKLSASSPSTVQPE
jgi:hypothetical protein